jgi:plasminogen activator inhibitor 1 RNA-binding protein
MSFAQNRFDALLGDEDTEVDKLGNVKPKEKKDADKPPTRRDVRRNGQRQPAGKNKIKIK